MGLLPDTQKCRMRMHRECRERLPCHWLQRKPLVSDPGMHQGTCVTHVPWHMSESLTRGGEGNVPGIPCACATHNFTLPIRGPLHMAYRRYLLKKLLSFDILHVLKLYTMVWNHFSMRHSKEIMFSCRPLNAKIHMTFSMFSGYQK